MEREGEGEGHEELGNVTAGEKRTVITSESWIVPEAEVTSSEEQWVWKGLLGEGSLLLPSQVLVPQLPVVPPAATVPFAVGSLPSSLLVARRHGVRRWSRGQQHSLPSPGAGGGKGCERLATNLGSPQPLGAPR